MDRWYSRFKQNLLQQGVEEVGIPKEMISGFYLDLIFALQKGSSFDVKAKLEKFPHHDINGFRLKLSALLEIFLSGEEIFREVLLSNNLGKPLFSWDQAATFLEKINSAFHAITQRYTDVFCKDCLRAYYRRNPYYNKDLYSEDLTLNAYKDD